MSNTNSATTAPSIVSAISSSTVTTGQSSQPFLLSVAPRQLRTTSPLNNTAANSWIPTVSGVSGLSRVASQPSAELSTSSVHATSVSPLPRPLSDPVRSIGEAISGDLPAVSLSSFQPPATAMVRTGSTVDQHPLPSIRFTPHIDVRATRESLHFTPIERTLRTRDERIRVGRYSDRDAGNLSAPVGFKSKVVSRRHCEFWCDGGQWFVKDVKSSSGTFLNHIRLSPPGLESKAYPLNDGDILQLGIDFKGGEEQIFRCVKIRVELNRAWQKALNNFNMLAHRRLRDLANSSKDTDASSLNSSECVICLLPIAPCQCLFVAPCSHVWHYKCIRPLVEKEYPTFLCPNCRAIADLESDIEDETANEIWEVMSQQTPGVMTHNLGQMPTGAVGVGEATTATAVVTSGAAVISGPSSGGLNPARDPEFPTTAFVAGSPQELIQSSISPPPSLSQLARVESPSTPIHQPSGSWCNRRNANAECSTSAHNDSSSENGCGDSSGGETGHEGPMTPMNDAGPFVLDGGDHVDRGRREAFFAPLD